MYLNNGVKITNTANEKRFLILLRFSYSSYGILQVFVTFEQCPSHTTSALAREQTLMRFAEVRSVKVSSFKLGKLLRGID